eukprot:gnl/Hemi2/28792_TR9546_c0_g1_i1.p1 gnl/Hemi2/28792_TR9546_c0_g1~~gnl/Hemi2/28792_TR9546_c0_g1_i1.p1  ORF type:complete len:388 (+),score=25.08 gnl/Hemi2/28792_TR9546_c0_g1_i1:169-1332(+)
MHKYRLLGKKGEGTFSEVMKAQSLENGKHHAIKRMKHRYSSYEQVYNLREVQALRRLSPHANIVKMIEVIYDQPSGSLSLVFELMDVNIYELIKDRTDYLPEKLTKLYMFQLLKAVYHMHKNGIFHRDIKPENILIKNESLKLADFGSCKGIYSRPPYTEYISTRWYRAPECILTDGYYGYKMDLWGVGCVMFEVMSLYPLFPGKNELDQIQRIHDIVGTPKPEVLRKIKRRPAMRIRFPQRHASGLSRLLPHASPEFVDLITKLLAYDPEARYSAGQALRHPYFADLREAEGRAATVERPLNSNEKHTPIDKEDSESASSSSKTTLPPIRGAAGANPAALAQPAQQPPQPGLMGLMISQAAAKKHHTTQQPLKKPNRAGIPSMAHG